MEKHYERTLVAIRDLTRANSYSPTLRELRDATGYSSLQTIHRHLTTLERMKMITRTPSPRTIVITDAGLDYLASEA